MRGGVECEPSPSLTGPLRCLHHRRGQHRREYGEGSSASSSTLARHRIRLGREAVAGGQLPHTNELVPCHGVRRRRRVAPARHHRHGRHSRWHHHRGHGQHKHPLAEPWIRAAAMAADSLSAPHGGVVHDDRRPRPAVAAHMAGEPLGPLDFRDRERHTTTRCT